MIKLLMSSEKTNSFRPTPWHWSTENFPAFRGCGWRHRGFLAVAKSYQPPDDFEETKLDLSPTKIIKTKEKGTIFLVPCTKQEDEKIVLITLSGGFRGGYSRIQTSGCEIIFCKTSGGHCVVTGHLIARIVEPNGYIFAETGRRCSVGIVEVFSWDGYKIFPTEEFEVWHSGIV